MFTRKYLIRLIVPLIVEQLLAATIGLANTLMVSNAGEAVVSGVALVDTVNQLMLNLFAALATGGAIVCAQYLGRDDDEKAHDAAGQLIAATAIFSVVLMALLLVFKGPVLQLSIGRAAEDVMSNASIYFFVSVLSYPFIALYSACSALYRSMGNTRVPLLVSVLMNAINISGSAILIYGLKMGALGAAIALLIARVTGCAVIMLLLTHRSNRLFLDFRSILRMKPTMIPRILSIGIPNGVENSLFQLGKILVQGVVVSFGTSAIAANAVANSISNMTNVPGSAVGLAVMTVIGQCMGAGRHDEAKRYLKQLTLLSVLIVGGTNLVALAVMNPVLSLYGLEPESLELARQFVISCSVGGILFWSFSFTLPNGLRAAGDVRYTMIVSIISMWSFRLAAGYLLASPLGLGPIGVWIGMSADWLFRMILFLWRYRNGKWLKHTVV